MIMGGMVLETSLQEIVSRFHEQQKIAKSEVCFIMISRMVKVSRHFVPYDACCKYIGEYYTRKFGENIFKNRAPCNA